MLKATGAVEKVTSRVTDRWIIWSKEMPERMLRRSRIFVIANTVVLSIVVAVVFFEFIATSLLQDSILFRTQPWVDAQIPLFLLWARATQQHILSAFILQSVLTLQRLSSVEFGLLC